LDVLQADVALRRATNQQTVAETALTAARKELNLLIGRPPESEVRAVGPLSLAPPPGELPMLLNEARTNRPDLKAARARLRKAEEALKLVKAEQVLPIVRLSATFDHKQDFDSRNNLGLVSLSVPLPLFNRRQGDLEAALADREKRQAEIDQIGAAIEKEVSAAYQVAVSSRKIVEQYVDHILPEQEENLRLLRMGYQQGEFRLTEVLVGQRDFIDARGTYLDAVAGLNGAVAELYRAVGARP
jgi:cobalt-zinc-cadmium efflux system outer membrane protein